jgi:hypothetical protein
MDQTATGWWNTSGLLGRVGAAALRRNFPFTHWFAQARAVIAAASHRSSEVFPLPKNCVSLWKLPPDVEAALSEDWARWLCDEEGWGSFFESVAALSGKSVSQALQHVGLATRPEIAVVESLKRSHEGKAVLIPSRVPVDNAVATQLALGFAHGELGRLTVPYMRLPGDPN